MSLLVLTINNFATPLDKKVQEVERISRLLEQAQHNIFGGGGVVTSGNLVDSGPQGNVVLGTWTYTAQAST